MWLLHRFYDGLRIQSKILLFIPSVVRTGFGAKFDPNQRKYESRNVGLNSDISFHFHTTSVDHWLGRLTDRNRLFFTHCCYLFTNPNYHRNISTTTPNRFFSDRTDFETTLAEQIRQGNRSTKRSKTIYTLIYYLGQNIFSEHRPMSSRLLRAVDDDDANILNSSHLGHSIGVIQTLFTVTAKKYITILNYRVLVNVILARKF